jgi:hypothetical protein
MVKLFSTNSSTLPAKRIIGKGKLSDIYILYTNKIATEKNEELLKKNVKISRLCM